MTVDQLQQQIGEFLKFNISKTPVPYSTHNVEEQKGYYRNHISFLNLEGEQIPAYLLLPDGDGPFPAVLIHHQHNGQRHLGKSEVCGLVGDPLQAFGPALARQKVAVLAPDSICFEDRRRNQTGIDPHEDDVPQHYNEMCYRLLRGDTLMRRVIEDSALGISLLCDHPLVDPERVGILGHSYGGNTVLFHGALDERIRFACASGAVCSYQYRMEHGVGIEMAEVIPGFATRYDIHDLVTCFSPRPLLLVSATEDPFSQDADLIVERAGETCTKFGANENIEHKRFIGEHALTKQRFKFILNWLFEIME
jgi:dienelactone hydrolase